MNSQIIVTYLLKNQDHMFSALFSHTEDSATLCHLASNITCSTLHKLITLYFNAYLSKEREYRSHKSDKHFLSFILENRYIFYIFALVSPLDKIP